jgi:hypothetical protein
MGGIKFPSGEGWREATGWLNDTYNINGKVFEKSTRKNCLSYLYYQ